MHIDLPSIAPFHQQAHDIGDYLYAERSREAEARIREDAARRPVAEPYSSD